MPRAALLLGGALAFLPPPAPAPSSRRFSAQGLTPESAMTRLKVAAQTKQVPVNELIDCLACIEEQAASQDAATLSSRMQSQLTGCWRLVYMSARSNPYCPGNLVLTLDTMAETISTTIYRFEAFKEYEKSGKLFWDPAKRRIEFEYERETAMFGLIRDKDYEAPRNEQPDAEAPKGQRYDAWYDMIWMDRDVAFARGCTGCLYLWRRDRELEMENGI